MSWDGLIFRAPEVRSVNDLPKDYVLPSLGTTEEIGTVLRELFPDQSHHHGQCCVEGDGFWLELNFGYPKDKPVREHIGVRCNAGLGAMSVLRQVCEAFAARLVDVQTSDFADFDADTQTSMRTFAEWRDRNLSPRDSTHED
ncbi:MAG: hypothetical protein Q8K78_19060 [Planctomycetaceae bacterium]|nr:hypothetical protein [Planctomycetaceae bacterium]